MDGAATSTLRQRPPARGPLHRRHIGMLLWRSTLDLVLGRLQAHTHLRTVSRLGLLGAQRTRPRALNAFTPRHCSGTCGQYASMAAPTTSKSACPAYQARPGWPRSCCYNNSVVPPITLAMVERPACKLMLGSGPRGYSTQISPIGKLCHGELHAGVVEQGRAC
jgi:hypothetical protein